MRRVILYVFAALGLLSVLAFLGGVGVFVAALMLAPHPTVLPGAIVLEADFNHDLAEGPSPDLVSRALFGSKTTLRDVLDALQRGADDPRVKGLYARLGDDEIGFAETQELRDAIAAFRAKGKFAIAFADTFGEFGPGTRPYYLATAFDQIWLQPMGTVGLTGLYSETPFVRDTLAKIGVSADFDRRSDYKTVMNTFTESAMPAPQREEIDGLLDSIDGQLVRGISAARQISAGKLHALIDRAPLFADEAKTAHLVDRLGYRDEAVVAARQRAGGGRLVALSRYLAGAGRPNRSGAAIALIYGTGLISREGSGAGAGLFDENGLVADKVAAAFRDAADDKSVRAILFRIDSRGGSVVGSETVWRAVVEARRRGKPVIVSMGDVAGSGGYYIAAPADKIVAEPATLTGSIGVVAGKFIVAGLLQKLGIGIAADGRGADAGMFSAMQDFSPPMQQRLDDMLDRVYRGFKERVAEGRHLSPDAVEAVAQGRVWTGEQAKEKGLVDAVGGYAVALRLARQAAGLAADAPIRLVLYPRPKGTLAELLDRLSGSGDGAPNGIVGPLGARLADLGALLARLEDLVAAPGTVRMPPIGDPR